MSGPNNERATDADFTVVNGSVLAAQRAQSGPWRIYSSVGRALGALGAVVTFIVAWILCAASYGFLLGGSLGWIPSAILAGIVYFLLWRAWPLILLVGLVAGGAAYNNSRRTSETAAATSSLPAVPTVPEPQLAPPPGPPPPSAEDAGRAVSDFRAAYNFNKGFAGAVTLTMNCYSGLQPNPTWRGWDYCAAVDELGEMTSRSTQYPVDFYSPNSVQTRQYKAANQISSDNMAISDRMAALRVILAQAISDKDAADNAAAAAAVEADRAAAEKAAHQPSFDCTKVVSQNLKLICDTPALADADQQLVLAYTAAWNATSDKAALQESQRQWLRRRNALPPVVATLAVSYSDRIEQLRVLGASSPPPPPGESH
jgi:uncharacterized protein YecT (DUF1311 family)